MIRIVDPHDHRHSLRDLAVPGLCLFRFESPLLDLRDVHVHAEEPTKLSRLAPARDDDLHDLAVHPIVAAQSEIRS